MEVGEGAAVPGTASTSDPATTDSDSSGDQQVTIIDELGMPMANLAVKVTLDDGSEQSLTTDSSGVVKVSVKPGSTYTVTIDDIHEYAIGDQSQTRSGQHFAQGGTPPAGGSSETS